MTKQIKIIQDSIIPSGLIIFISGVPGVGKTTISYEILKRFSEFRIIEETDLIRETLRGYNDFLQTEFGNQINFVFDNVEITDHRKLLTFEEAKVQCKIMKKSLEQIVYRQQRKGIASIINGVHVIPEMLYGIAENNNIIYINLFVSNEHEIYKRILNRDPTSYMLDYIPFIFQTNKDLYVSTERILSKNHCIFNIDVTGLSINDTIAKVIFCINTYQNALNK